MKESQSTYVPVRGLDYHCRTWGDRQSPCLFLLHGFQDLSASWQFTVDALAREWYVVAPDWRGYGLTSGGGADTFWFPDLVADLDVILDHFEPEFPARVVGHSMGGNTASIYAGATPQRIAKFVNVEGLGAGNTPIEEAPRRYARWLQQLARVPRQRPYMDMRDFAERMISENPRLTPERAMFLVEHLGKEDSDGTVNRRAEPAQMYVKPNMFRVDEAMACWRKIEAPVLWVEGAESRFINNMRGEVYGYEDRLNAFQTLTDVVRVEGAGHNIHHDQPEELASIIESFM